jgi:hypothetical protein
MSFLTKRLRIALRHPDIDGGGYTVASIYDANGALKKEVSAGNRSQVEAIECTSPTDAQLFISIGGNYTIVPNGVYRILIQ